ncbi:MAG TPA: heat shock protein HspQ [Alphaproteobacteria bacterium]|nr:heat shock protein HspQ [Alphaproteobacteria bacterium]
MPAEAKFQVGALVHHRLFDYRGVVFDVDGAFRGSDDWYDTMARSRPPKDAPWYHVLVHGAAHTTPITTYVAERNLAPDASGAPIQHALVDSYFEGMTDGLYVPRRRLN